MSALILGIESSCDETSAAVVRQSGGSLELLSDVTARQEEVHERFGGVVPELASRKHLESLLPVVKMALEKAGAKYQDLNAIAVTNRPGLIGSLMIGVNAARTLAYALEIPVIPINHLEAHLAAVLLEGSKVRFPCLGLIISGGHTSFFQISEDWQKFEGVAHTRDDAAGEAFDKGARILGLPYPGGPAMARLAEKGDPKAVHFPRALPAWDDLDFSFSGLKTSLLQYQQKHPEQTKENICASFQEAIVDSLVQKSLRALERTKAKDFVVAGGVASNQRLRQKLREALPKDIILHIPSPKYCTDNGAMIAALGSVRWKQKNFIAGEALFSLEVSPSTEAKLMRGKQ